MGSWFVLLLLPAAIVVRVAIPIRVRIGIRVGIRIAVSIRIRRISRRRRRWRRSIGRWIAIRRTLRIGSISGTPLRGYALLQLRSFLRRDRLNRSWAGQVEAKQRLWWNHAARARSSSRRPQSYAGPGYRADRRTRTTSSNRPDGRAQCRASNRIRRRVAALARAAGVKRIGRQHIRAAAKA